MDDNRLWDKMEAMHKDIVETKILSAENRKDLDAISSNVERLELRVDVCDERHSSLVWKVVGASGAAIIGLMSAMWSLIKAGGSLK